MDAKTLPPNSAADRGASEYEAAIARLGEANTRLAYMAARFFGLDISEALSAGPASAREAA